MTIHREPDFAKAAHQASKLLAEQDLTAGPVHIKNFFFEKNICFYSAKEISRKYPLSGIPEDFERNCDGATLYSQKKDAYLVIYSEQGKAQRIHWNIIHEVGHIEMGHTRDSLVIEHEASEEKEAHFFASNVTIPDFTYYMIDRNYKDFDWRDLTHLFNVSDQAAYKKNLTMLRKTFVSATAADRHIWDMLEDYVADYYARKRKWRALEDRKRKAEEERRQQRRDWEESPDALKWCSWNHDCQKDAEPLNPYEWYEINC